MLRFVSDVANMSGSKFEEFRVLSLWALKKLLFTVLKLSNFENSVQSCLHMLLASCKLLILLKDHFFSVLILSMKLDIAKFPNYLGEIDVLNLIYGTNNGFLQV